MVFTAQVVPSPSNNPYFYVLFQTTAADFSQTNVIAQFDDIDSANNAAALFNQINPLLSVNPPAQ
jgi:hypothetical protein